MASLEEFARRRKMMQEQMARALSQPTTIAPGEAPAKAWQPLIGMLGGMIQDKRLAGQEKEAKAKYQKTLADALAPGVDTDTAARALIQNPDTADLGMKLFLSQRKAATDVPAGLQEFREFEKSDPNRQKQWLEFKRGPNIMNLGSEMAVRDPRGGISERYSVGLKPTEQLGYIGEREATKTVSEARAKQDMKAIASAKNIPPKLEQVVGKIDEALENVGFFTTGFPGAIGRKIPGTSAFDLDRTVDTLKANLGFDALQAMRDASPTGGALGQVAIQELAMLQAQVASLDTAQSEDQLKRNLEQIRTHYGNWRRIVEESAREASQRQGVQTQPTNAAPQQGGSPQAGTVEDGYIFMGGDPADPKSWKKQQ